MSGRRWADDAVCARLDPQEADAVFFGRNGSGGPSASQIIQRARAVCERCPVMSECLADALAVPTVFDRHGVGAGLLPDERADLRHEDRLTRREREEASLVWLGGERVVQSHRRRHSAADSLGRGSHDKPVTSGSPITSTEVTSPVKHAKRVYM